MKTGSNTSYKASEKMENEVGFWESQKSKVTVNGKAIVRNLEYLKGISSGNCLIMPVIKSDAYGHGILDTARLLQDKGIWGFGIYEMEEAAILRRSGIDCPIFTLSGLLGDDASKAIELDLTVGAITIDEVENLNSIASLMGKQVKVHLKVDTGMYRFGMTPQEILYLARKMNRFSHIEFEGLYSHFACSDEPSNLANKRQLGQFVDLLNHLHLIGWKPKYVHMANSAALLYMKESRFNLARPGIAIYGALQVPNNKETVSDLEQAMSFSSLVLYIKDLPNGACISYGHTFRATKDMRVALVPVGYDNGYPRALSNKAHVLVNGVACPVIGNICMKTIMVDVSHVRCRHGDEVILMGRQQDLFISAVELAHSAATISYELLCLLGKLNKRIFLE